jgi:hypothetical protein
MDVLKCNGKREKHEPPFVLFCENNSKKGVFGIPYTRWKGRIIKKKRKKDIK